MTEQIPDFDALRATRNRAVEERLRGLADDLGVPLEMLRSSHNPDACYCACTSGGPCEHDWTGAGIEFDDGCGWSVTCSRCGITAMSHDMRVLP
jgi:hypothetical protein